MFKSFGCFASGVAVVITVIFQSGLHAKATCAALVNSTAMEPRLVQLADWQGRKSITKSPFALLPWKVRAIYLAQLAALYEVRSENFSGQTRFVDVNSFFVDPLAFTKFLNDRGYDDIISASVAGVKILYSGKAGLRDYKLKWDVEKLRALFDEMGLTFPKEVFLPVTRPIYFFDPATQLQMITASQPNIVAMVGTRGYRKTLVSAQSGRMVGTPTDQLFVRTIRQYHLGGAQPIRPEILYNLIDQYSSIETIGEKSF